MAVASMDHRGIDAVLKDMRQHPEDAKVQEKGCRALWNLAHNLFGNADNAVKIGAWGGVDAIVQAMGWHPGSEGVQENCCGALKKLAVNADNAVKIGAGGGVEAIVQAMGGHPGSGELQRYCCGALGTLGQSNRDIQQRIKRAGAEEAVQRAMASPDATAKTKEHGQKLLSLLSNV